MNLQDTLYNWLSIRKVSQERADDKAAIETFEFFDLMLREDHHVSDIDIVIDPPMYIVHYTIEGEKQKTQFPIELIDSLFESIHAEPKYN
ncbi:hypothetical protein [Pseudalkalibacillus berkeleyi]|uniref:Uncharacterized protein n=1 Tax=Pseudalkalibacillus berkeleyi TaxID=1069813 RepID=A0ABS9GZN9_9BACL|nr:hypothetical protein [Pseudalkalibacillus berkeleyi]MCF6136958.1 hypothetical protein [Pseudalkalibacillus berkeleyi]